jgi:hypothetical protein
MPSFIISNKAKADLKEIGHYTQEKLEKKILDLPITTPPFGHPSTASQKK